MNELGIGFILDANYHRVMRPIVLVRWSIKIRIALNCLGPMWNPAKVVYAVVGVYRRDLGSELCDNCLVYF